MVEFIAEFEVRDFRRLADVKRLIISIKSETSEGEGKIR